LIFQKKQQTSARTKNFSKKLFYTLVSYIIFTQLLIAQNDTVIKNDSLYNNFNASISLQGMVASDGDLPFWLFNNTLGRVDAQTNFLTLGDFGYTRSVSEKATVDTKVGVLYNDFDGVIIDQLYATYKNSWFDFNLGLKHRDVLLDDLSSVGGDILWTGNARAMPGAELSTARTIKLLKWFGFRATIAHYELNDTRVVDGAMIHHKSLYLDFNLSKTSNFFAGLAHYVQWGGFSQEFGQQEESFSSFAKAFVGKGGGNTINDQLNAVGNHVASYHLSYDKEMTNYNIKLYHQNLFEDRSGRELRNFPDGIWGIFLQPNKNKLITSILYEYVQTVSQSGRRLVQGGEGNGSGLDNYFNSGIYQTGWVYNGNTIGVPFIIPREDNLGVAINRSIAHHLGVFGYLSKFEYRVKATYAEYLGTYQEPIIPREKAMYLYGQLAYPSKYGSLSVQIGLDYSNYTKENFGVNFGYRYDVFK
jgi:hypothetical protein